MAGVWLRNQTVLSTCKVDRFLLVFFFLEYASNTKQYRVTDSSCGANSMQFVLGQRGEVTLSN